MLLKLAAFALVLSLQTMLARAENLAAHYADPFVWLEDVNGARAMGLGPCGECQDVERIEKDARYPLLFASAVALAEAPETHPQADVLGGESSTCGRTPPISMEFGAATSPRRLWHPGASLANAHRRR